MSLPYHNGAGHKNPSTKSNCANKTCKRNYMFSLHFQHVTSQIPNVRGIAHMPPAMQVPLWAPSQEEVTPRKRAHVHWSSSSSSSPSLPPAASFAAAACNHKQLAILGKQQTWAPHPSSSGHPYPFFSALSFGAFGKHSKKGERNTWKHKSSGGA